MIMVSHCYGKSSIGKSSNGNSSPFEAQDLGLNQTEKFHVMTAALVTSVVPGGMGAGYYIYDRPDIGKKYLITQSLLAATSLGLAFSCPEKKSKVLIDPDCKGNTKLALNLIFTAFLSIWIWQIFDVVANGKSYISQNSFSIQFDSSRDNNLIFAMNFNF